MDLDLALSSAAIIKTTTSTSYDALVPSLGALDNLLTKYTKPNIDLVQTEHEINVTGRTCEQIIARILLLEKAQSSLIASANVAQLQLWHFTNSIQRSFYGRTIQTELFALDKELWQTGQYSMLAKVREQEHKAAVLKLRQEETQQDDLQLVQRAEQQWSNRQLKLAQLNIDRYRLVKGSFARLKQEACVRSCQEEQLLLAMFNLSDEEDTGVKVSAVDVRAVFSKDVSNILERMQTNAETVPNPGAGYSVRAGYDTVQEFMCIVDNPSLIMASLEEAGYLARVSYEHE